jgi:hypothetical protein
MNDKPAEPKEQGAVIPMNKHNPVLRAGWRASAQRLAVATVGLMVGCAPQPEAVQDELFPETQQPHFKTCIAKIAGTYHERELQQHYMVDIYKEPAPDQGPMTADCVVRQ